MKKLYNICFLLALMAFVACSPEEDDLFDQSAAARIDAAIKEDLAVLRGATNGWVLEYYPSKSKMFGGFTMLVSFNEDGTSNVSCDLFTADKVVKSQYEVKQSTGVMLTFDTYNEIFHFFSEPSNFLGIGETGDGMAGDYEFLILECSPQKVVLKGKKTGNEMVMTPLAADKTWSDYMKDVKAVTFEAFQALYDVKVGENIEYAVTQKYHVFVLTNKDGSEKNFPFVYTPEGIKFNEPISIGSQLVQELKWDSNAKVYKNGDISFKAQALPAGYKKYDEFIGAYQFVYDEGVVTNVILKEELFNNSFIMEGFPSDIRVVYKAAYGVIGIETQELGGNVSLCPWALDRGGSIATKAGYGMVGVNGNNGVIIFEDNGIWGITDSFIAYDIANRKSVFQIPYVLGMIKK